MAGKQSNTVTLMAGGDIGPVHEPTEQFCELILPTLQQADLRFGQCERAFSERGMDPHWSRGPGGEHARQHPRMAGLWKAANIDVVSVASNHTPDWGPEALLDTVDMFRGWGKTVIGAGRNEKEARTPAIVERNGIRIAFLGYSSVSRDGQHAEEERPGVTPMRAYTYYLPEDNQPGTPPDVMTVPHKEDLEALQADIRGAKQKADVVVMSIHWGLHHVEKTICDYQQPIAHAAIDAGADLILGHHAHCLKAVEVYKGKVCFYSIGNFMTTGRAKRSLNSYKKWNVVWLRPDEECLPPHGLYPFPAYSRKTMVAKAVFSKNGVEKISFLPTYINHRAQPYALKAGEPLFNDVLDYTEWVSDQHPHKFRVEGDEVVVEPAT